MNAAAQPGLDASPLLDALRLDRALIASLPPDVRDQVLDYVAAWGAPEELLSLAALLREVHGPLLFLLDYQAAALLRMGLPADALQAVERRQRRSTTIASQALEAETLLALGKTPHARAVADDLAQSYPRHIAAVSAAGAVFTAAGDFPAARALFETYLEWRPGDATATAVLAQLAQRAGDAALADQYLQRLGSAVSPELDDTQTRRLAELLAALGRLETAQAARFELERRRLLQLEALQIALAPFTALDPAARTDSGQIYHRLNGPESVHVTREERRRVQIETIRHFGFPGLRSGQAETIAAVLRGESLLTVMPTGAGKSLCYQLPALVLPRASLVISPLIALMKDQVESLPPAARARATFINSTLSDEELAARMAGVARGDYKLVYAAPERLRQREFLRALRRAGLDLFVVDEAHCVSLWGHDFRTDYLFLQEARRELGNPATLAMTATAPPRVRDEILDYMRNEVPADADAAADAAGRTPPSENTAAGHSARPRVVTLDIFRSNLHLSALRFHNEDEKLSAVLKFARETPGSGIVYVNTRRKSESLAYALREAGVQAEAYHAGLENRGPVQDRFMAGQTRVVVATVAFGMGIDKADIRFIVHFHPSRSLAGYYQEVGRAGRDGLPSQGVLFYSNNDWANLRRWAKADEYGPEFLERVYNALAAQLGVAVGTAGENGAAPRATIGGPVDARRLQQVLNADETLVRVAVSILERADLLTRGFDVAQEAVVTLPRKLPPAVAEQARNDADFRDLLRGLNLGPGASAPFKLADIAAFMGWGAPDCEAMLLDWQDAGYLAVKLGRRAMSVELPPRPADFTERIRRILEQASAVAQRRIDDIAGYATTEGCRHGYISAHFGSPPRTHCDVCDNDTGIRPDLPVPEEIPNILPDDADIAPMILDCLISLPKPVGRSGLARILAGSLKAVVTPDKARHFGALKPLGEGGVLEYVDDLLETNRLRQYERQGYLALAPTMSGRTEAEAWLADHPELAVYGAAPLPDAGGEGAQGPDEAAAQGAGDRYTALQKALWLWRRRLAEQLGQPPYVVMSNELMLQIAETRPQGLEELGALHGMGTQRLDHYGPAVLDLINLNPPLPGDDALLAAQRAELAEAKAAAAAAPKRESVSSRLERQIFMHLQEMRQRRSVAARESQSEIASPSLLKAIARHAPASLEELEAIPGFRSSGLRTDGPQIVTYIAALRAQDRSE